MSALPPGRSARGTSRIEVKRPLRRPCRSRLGGKQSQEPDIPERRRFTLVRGNTTMPNQRLLFPVGCPVRAVASTDANGQSSPMKAVQLASSQ